MLVKHHYRLELLPVGSTAADLYGYSLRNMYGDNAGFDLYCSQDENVTTGNVSLIPLRVQARMVRVNDETGEEEDCHFWLLPRSSTYKRGLLMANSVGVIDKSYRGELMAPVYAVRDAQVFAGERLFQIVAPDMGHIKHMLLVYELPDTSRGSQGFGSTGL